MIYFANKSSNCVPYLCRSANNSRNSTLTTYIGVLHYDEKRFFLHLVLFHSFYNVLWIFFIKLETHFTSYKYTQCFIIICSIYFEFNLLNSFYIVNVDNVSAGVCPKLRRLFEDAFYL